MYNKERIEGYQCINHDCEFFDTGYSENCFAEIGGCPAVELCDKYIPDYKNTFERLKAENKSLKRQVEDLKCCGSCGDWENCVSPVRVRKYYRSCWKSDGMTREEREIK